MSGDLNRDSNSIMEITANSLVLAQERLDNVAAYISSRNFLPTSLKLEAKGIGLVRGQPT